MLGHPFNRDRISPIYKAGAVNLNGHMNASDISARLQRLDAASDSILGARIAPYYDPPTGAHGNSFRTLEIAEFAFRNRDFTNAEMQESQRTPAAFSDNVGIAVMTTLNLLGNYDEDMDDSEMREAIMLKLQFIGVVVADNRVNNESHVTLMSGGLMTVQYNGTKPGNAGDWLILEAPSRIDLANKKGGKDTAEEQEGGRVTLRLGPYDSKIHSHTPKYVYAALKMMEEDLLRAKRTYLHSYLVMCAAMYASMCKIVAAGIVGLVSVGVLGDGPRGTAAEAVSALCGTTVNGTPLPNNHKEIRYLVRDAIFANYIRQRGSRAINPDTVPVQAMEGVGLYMHAAADLVRVVLERVVCKALTAYSEKLDLDVTFIQPAR